MRRYFIALFLVCLSVITLSSCGVSQNEYDSMKQAFDDSLKANNLLSQNYQEAQDTIIKQQQEIESIKQEAKLKYFTNRTEIQKWLDLVPKLGVSEDVVQWYQYALYYQNDALEKGFIVSTAFWVTEDDSIDVWCEMVTEDGKVYYFNPDDCKLKESIMEVPMVSPEELKNSSHVKLQ